MQKKGRKKQARLNKQQGKATQHTQGSHFSKGKMSYVYMYLGWDLNLCTPYSRQSALSAELPREAHMYICHNIPVSHTVHLLRDRIMYTCMGSVSVCRYIYVYTYRVVGTCIPVLAASSTSTNSVYKTKIHCTVIVVPCQDLYMCYTYVNMYILYIYTCMSSSRSLSGG